MIPVTIFFSLVGIGEERLKSLHILEPSRDRFYLQVLGPLITYGFLRESTAQAILMDSTYSWIPRSSRYSCRSVPLVWSSMDREKKASPITNDPVYFFL